MVYSTRARFLPGIVLPSYRYWFGGTTYASGAGSTILAGTQTTYSWRTSGKKKSEEEYGLLSTSVLKDEIKREYRDRFDTGHEFWTESSSWTWSPTFIRVDATNNVHYEGFLGTGTPFKADPIFQYPSETKVTVDGTEGVRRTYPTRPEAGLATAIAELKRDLPHLPGMLLAGLHGHRPVPRGGVASEIRRKNPGVKTITKRLSEEFLNYEFGILPTAADLEKLCKAVKQSVKIVRQMQRDSGNTVHRRVQLYDTTTSVSRPDESMNLGLGSVSGTSRPAGYLSSYSPACSVVDEVQQRAWFSGAYEYHLAETHRLLQRMGNYEQQANRLLGIRITLDVIWELTPWSWLIDWFTDVGDIIENVTALHDDDLVLKYGYVMHETHAKRIWTSRSVLRSSKGYFVADRPVLVHSIHRKQRTRATPYGFGIDVSGLSPRRWAILSALGLSRSTGSLRND